MRHLLPLLLALAACSNDPNPLGCTPGAQLACACPGGASSVQVCTSAGTLGACACPDAGPVDVAPTVDASAVDAPALPDACASATVGNCCGVACPTPANGAPACVAGRCMLASCSAPFADCDGNPANGCEVDTRSSAAHCGACGAACAAGRVCSAGACDACDVDGDGARARSCGGMDCDDNDPATRPDGVERCDGFDNNCDGRGDAEHPEDFTAECARLVNTAYPETMNTSPARCDQVPAAGRPSGTERFPMACRRQVVSGGAVRCYCVAPGGARWQCGCN